MPKNRVFFLDLLRIGAVYGVILGHICTWKIESIVPGTFFWNVCSLYNGLLRVTVPILLMISGYLWLNPATQGSIWQNARRRAKKYLGVFVFWSALYALFSAFERLKASGRFGLKPFLSDFTGGEFHLWYLLLLIGLALCLPLFDCVVQTRRCAALFLGVAFVSTILLPTLQLLPGFAWLSSPLKSFYLNTGYSFYFILGAYLRRWPFLPKLRVFVYTAGAAGCVWTVWATWYASCRAGAWRDLWLDQRSLGVAAAAAAVFVLALRCGQTWQPHPRAERLLCRFTPDTLGIYTVHVFFLLLFQAVGVQPDPRFSPVVLPLLALAVFLLSAAAAACLRRLPFVRRFV